MLLASIREEPNMSQMIKAIMKDNTKGARRIYVSAVALWINHHYHCDLLVTSLLI